MKDVLDFIDHFKGSENVFLNGCCYWFAKILELRFNDDGYLVDIFHDPIENHFIARFIKMPMWEYEGSNGMKRADDIRFFDIRGDVTDLYNEEGLENVWILEKTDERRWGKLMCDCRDFIDPENYPKWIQY